MMSEEVNIERNPHKIASQLTCSLVLHGDMHVFLKYYSFNQLDLINTFYKFLLRYLYCFGALVLKTNSKIMKSMSKSSSDTDKSSYYSICKYWFEQP